MKDTDTIEYQDDTHAFHFPHFIIDLTADDDSDDQHSATRITLQCNDKQDPLEAAEDNGRTLCTIHDTPQRELIDEVCSWTHMNSEPTLSQDEDHSLLSAFIHSASLNPRRHAETRCQESYQLSR